MYVLTEFNNGVDQILITGINGDIWSVQVPTKTKFTNDPEIIELRTAK